MMRLFWQGFQGGEYAVRAGIYGEGRNVAPGDDSIFIDDEESAFADAFGFAIGAVGLSGGALGLEIGEERKSQMAIFCECFVAPNAVDGDAEKFGVELCEFGKHFVVESHLIAADGAEVRGIKREDYRTAAEFAEREALI